MIIVTYNPKQHSLWNNIKNIGRILSGVEMSFSLSFEQAMIVARILAEAQKRQAKENKPPKKKKP